MIQLAAPGVLMSKPSFIIVTDVDHQRLQSTLQSAGGRTSPATEALEAELSRAVVVPSERVPDTVITMRSRFVYEDEATHEARVITLVYPTEANPKKDKVSVLSPLGTALLGLSVGQTIDWEVRKNCTKRYGIVELLYQPEAAGHFHL